MNILFWLDVPLVIFSLLALTPRLWTWLRRRHPDRPPPRGSLIFSATLLFYLGLGSLSVAAVDVGLAAWQRESQPDSEQERTGLFPLGTEAPDFCLPSVDGGRTVRLSDFRGHKPVVLIFGSFS